MKPLTARVVPHRPVSLPVDAGEILGRTLNGNPGCWAGLLGALALIASTSGCTSLNCRTQDSSQDNRGWDGLVYSKRYVFPGVEGDCRAMAAPCLDGNRGDAQMGSTVFGSVYCFFDLPFSLLVDTVCLPYDLYQVSCGGKTRSGKAREPEAVDGDPNKREPDACR